MQKNHKFLKGIKGRLDNLFSVKVSKYKNATIGIAYILATSLLVLTPDSLVNTNQSAIVKAQTTTSAIMEEETENAAIITAGIIGTSKTHEDVSDVKDAELLDAETETETVAGTLEGTIESQLEEKVLDEYNKILDKEAEAKAAKEEAKAEAIRIKEEKAAARQAEREAVKRAAEEQAAREQAEEEARVKAEKEAVEKAAAQKAALEAASTNVLSFSSKEIQILERIVEAEATGEDMKGKILVANVVLNRVNSKTFPNSIEGVVFEKRQFSPIRDGRYNSVSITGETKEAVSRSLQGEDYSDGALYFAARRIASTKNMNWFDNQLTYLFQYGCHEFFK